MSSRSFDVSLAVKERPATLAMSPKLMPRAQGDDVVAPVSNAYETAITLRETTKGSLLAVTSKKGPLAPPSRVDTWFKDHDIVCIAPAVGGLGFVIGGFASIGDIPAIASAALVGIGIALWGYTRHIARADKRLEAAAQRHASEQLDSTDIERALRPYLAAPAEQRAMLKPYVDFMLKPLGGNLSAKASIMLERLASELPAVSDQSAEHRASRLAHIVGELLERVPVSTHIAELEQVLEECSPAERKVVAGLLERTLFQSERSNAAGTQDEIKALYRVVERAYRGEGLPAGEAHSE